MYAAKGFKTGEICMISNSKPTLMLRLSRRYKYKSTTSKKSLQGYKEGHIYPEPLIITFERTEPNE